MAVVWQSADTVTPKEYFQGDLIIQKCCVDCLLLVQRGLNVLVGLKANISCLKVVGC